MYLFVTKFDVFKNKLKGKSFYQSQSFSIIHLKRVQLHNRFQLIFKFVHFQVKLGQHGPLPSCINDFDLRNFTNSHLPSLSHEIYAYIDVKHCTDRFVIARLQFHVTAILPVVNATPFPKNAITPRGSAILLAKLNQSLEDAYGFVFVSHLLSHSFVPGLYL